VSVSIKGTLACGMLLLALVAGCGSAATVAPAPSATTPLLPTGTPPPPTPALAPLPLTNTPALPTANPTTIPPPATPTVTPIAESTFDGVRVTYVFNAGFLITIGDRRVLIDAIYEGYPEGTLKPILQSQPPFDGVDLILATHEHVDHFSPSLVRQYMLANPNTVFASTQGAVRQLLALGDNLSSRVVPIEIAKGETLRFQVSGITVEAIYLSHGIPNFVNLGLVVTIGDVALFHTGDIDSDAVDVSYLRSYGLPEKRLDVAFVPHFFFTEEAYYAHMQAGIQARYLIPMHFGGRITPSPRFESIFPDFFIFSESYESWILPPALAAPSLYQAEEGRPCLACGTPLAKIRTGSTGSYICPGCQELERR
jgi:L-ascorbate metabolism protein UlaG (beta-lactamase superfamily)